MIRLVIVDDHEMLLEGVALAIDQEADIEVVGTAPTRAQAVEQCTALLPDVVIVDYRINGETGADLAKDLQAIDPAPAVVGMSALASDTVVDEMVAAGCVSFIHKRRGIAPLADAVRGAHEGIGHLPARAVHRADLLSQRELGVLQSMSEGHTATEIAEQLHLSLHTVRNHIREIRQKLQVSSQLSAVAEGVRRGMISGPEPL